MASYNIHAGHCPQGKGAYGAVGILKESVEDRLVKDEAIRLFKSQGHTVYDCTCEENTTQNGCLQKIVAKCNQHSVALDISIHLNSGRNDYKGDGKAGGVEVYNYDNRTKAISDRICKNISTALGITNRGSKESKNLYVLNNTKSPAILVECCFVDDRDDANRWDAKKCAKAIVEGVLNKTISSETDSKPVTQSDPDGIVKDNEGTFQSKTTKLGEVSYQGHLRGYGWAFWQCDGAMVGSIGQSRRIEALRIKPVGQMDVTVHMKDVGDKKYTNITEDTILGTVGESRRLEALKIESTDTIYLYRVHQKDIGWSAWCVNGQWAGTKGKSKQIEAVEIKVADIAYIGHVQETGDTIWMADGMTAGTTGQGKQLEAIRIKSQHCGDVYAKAHIQGIGWKDYGMVNKDTIIGTEGESLRIECLCLKGDFEWRAHIQGTGWTQWTDADGVATLGTVGQSLRIEAIEMRK